MLCLPSDQQVGSHASAQHTLNPTACSVQAAMRALGIPPGPEGSIVNHFMFIQYLKAIRITNITNYDLYKNLLRKAGQEK